MSKIKVIKKADSNEYYGGVIHIDDATGKVYKENNINWVPHPYFAIKFEVDEYYCNNNVHPENIVLMLDSRGTKCTIEEYEPSKEFTLHLTKGEIRQLRISLSKRRFEMIETAKGLRERGKQNSNLYANYLNRAAEAEELIRKISIQPQIVKYTIVSVGDGYVSYHNPSNGAFKFCSDKEKALKFEVDIPKEDSRLHAVIEDLAKCGITTTKSEYTRLVDMEV